jgi:hypothetical protein
MEMYIFDIKFFLDKYLIFPKLIIEVKTITVVYNHIIHCESALENHTNTLSPY